MKKILVICCMLVVVVSAFFRPTEDSTYIEVGDTFSQLRNKVGFPSTMVDGFNEKGIRYETIYIEDSNSAYVFRADQNTSMDTEASDDFVICKIIVNPEPNKAYFC